MFTGLVQDIGRIEAIEKDGDWRLAVHTGFDLSDAPQGASIMCSGVCLTAVEKSAHEFIAEVSQETLDKTNIKQWETGRHINLERSLKLGDELGGHLVFGHVDGLVKLISIKEDKDSKRLEFEAPENLMRFIAAKGSVTLDGTSLTVNSVTEKGFCVNIIPHTWAHTTFQYNEAGDVLNLEIDMLARYVARMMEFDQKGAS